MERILAGAAPEYTLQVFSTPAGDPHPVDSLGPVRSNAAPPAPARLLLAFWNTYPAYTPATALRRWDGAHTGPQGGRHGLYNLLRTARSADAPLFLLDLKNPASLSSLDFAGFLPQVLELAQNRQISLPEALPDPAYSPLPLIDGMAQELSRQDRQVSRGFGLPSSQALFAPAGWVPQDAPGRSVFIPLPGHSSLQAVTPIDGRGASSSPCQAYGDPQPAWQPGSDGLPLEARRALLETALASSVTGGPQPVLVFGGELPASAWGDPQIAREAFRYLNARPWVQILDEADLSGLIAAPHPPPGAPTPLSPPNPQDAPQAQALFNTLENAPDNELTRAAWQFVRTLYAPVYPGSPDLPELRRQGMAQAWALLEAAQWAENPSDRADCSGDPDRDGQPECVLASERFYALVEINSGVLTHAFARLQDPAQGASIHQIIGPSTQMISGLSDTSTWDLSGGIFAEPAAEPAAIPGAFADGYRGFQAEIEAGEVVLRSPGGEVVKRYRLTAEGFELSYLPLPSLPASVLRLPLALDPWLRFSPGWAAGYQALPAQGGLVWQAGDVYLQVSVNQPFTLATFADSLALFAATENPNLDYPPGHFLALPLAVVEMYPARGSDPAVIAIV